MPLIRKDPPSTVPSATPAGATDPGVRGTTGPLELLRTGTPGQRWNAARALSTNPDGTKALAEALKTETDTRVREAIFTGLVRTGSRESVDAVVPHLRSDDANLRMGALDALRAMIGAARPVVPALLADPDADIRVISCDLARELPAPEATRLLCDVLARDPELNVCAAAVDVLADIGEADALPFLEQCPDRFAGANFLRFAVKVAMERIVAERPAGHG